MNMEGKKATRIFYGRDGECLQEAKRADNGYVKEIILTTTFHGEYDIPWFCVYENGKEIVRINAKMVESIKWEKDDKSRSNTPGNPGNRCKKRHYPA